MATAHDPKTSSRSRRSGEGRPRPPRRVRWSREQYYRLAELGFFGRRRVELLLGEVWETMTTYAPHSRSSELVDMAIRPAFGVGYRFRIQQPLDLGRRSQPEPDFAVLRGSPRDGPGHPTSALLIIEISDSTLRKDRSLKVHVYAQAGLPDYGLLNLVDRQLEIYRNPGPDPARKGRFACADVTIVPADGHASPLAAPGARIAVADLLP